MKQNYTHIGVILDRSGSMHSCWTDTVGGFKSLIQENKKVDGQCTMTVAAFDNEYTLLEDFTDIQKVDEDLKILPRGGTALLDAIGKTVNSIGEKLNALDESERPERVQVAIMTDGQENASKEFTKDIIKSMITEQTEKYKWVFQFIGADLNAVNEAQTWGIDKQFATAYNTGKSSQMFDVLSKKMSMSRSATLENYAGTCSWTSEEKEAIN